MTIKQQGGIFGRNPTFNDAEVDDLTVTGSSTLNGAFSVQGNIGKLNQTADGNLFQIANGLNTEAAVVHVGSGRSGDGNTYIDLFGASGATFGARLIRNGGTNGATLLQTKGTGNLTVRTDDAAPVVIQTGGAEAARFNTSGNLAFPSGQGIDFSATAGTGTSELLDDYEEGTWTPVIAGNTVAGSNTYTVQNGYYTKIGNRVLINLDIAMSNKDAAMDGHVKITGLPFTPSTASNNQASMAFGRYDNVDLSAGYTQLVAMVQVSGTFLPREVGDNVAAQLIDDAAMSNTSRFQLSGHYFV